MKDRVDKSILRTFKAPEIRQMIEDKLKAEFHEQQAPKMTLVEIAEVSIPPSGVVITVRAIASVIDDVPDKVFKPPTRS